MESRDTWERVEVQTALAELVAQEPCCFYKMVDACLRRHALHVNRQKVLQGAGHFIHPSAATMLNRQQAAGGSKGHNSSASTEAGGGLLDNWKQTQAFLSALLSYRKVIQLLWDSVSASDLQRLDSGLYNTLLWFSEEGVLDVLRESGAAEEKGAKKSSSTGAAGAGSVKAKVISSSSADSAEATAADPKEGAACRILALCVLSRVTVTYCQQLAEGGSKGSRGSSSSSSTNGGSAGASSGSNVAALAKQLKQINFTETEIFNRLQLGCSLGMACYCLVKQVQQYGRSSSRSSGKGGSSTSTAGSSSGSGAASGAANNGSRSSPSSSSSTSKSGNDNSSNTSKGSSKGGGSKGGGEPAATALGTNSRSSQKWGGLQLQLPSPVLERLQKLEATVTCDTLRRECAVTKAVNSHMVLVEGVRVSVLGVPDYEGMVQLLEQLLGLCEGVVAAIPVPLGCNNPSCINLDGVSDASAAKVCSGCKKAHYCGTACVKAHWKEHKPYCE